jgi:uncharacterized protein YndB with AHSA1/START domain
MNAVNTVDDTIVQEVTIKARAERIFQALTSPEELLKWWGAEGKFWAEEVQCDLRPGGKWMMRVSGSCGTGSGTLVSGEYQRVEPPNVLIYTWIRENEEFPESVVRWDLEERDGRTTVRVTHSGLVTEEMRARNNGWPLIVGLLERYLA